MAKLTELDSAALRVLVFELLQKFDEEPNLEEAHLGPLNRGQTAALSRYVGITVAEKDPIKSTLKQVDRLKVEAARLAIKAAKQKLPDDSGGSSSSIAA